jgi:hypothetical protein
MKSQTLFGAVIALTLAATITPSAAGSASGTLNVGLIITGPNDGQNAKPAVQHRRANALPSAPRKTYAKTILYPMQWQSWKTPAPLKDTPPS